MTYWKIKLSAHNTPLGQAEFRTCEEADTLDQALAQARAGTGKAFQPGNGSSAAGQAFSDAENANPLAAEAIFLETGNFNAYLKGLG